MIEYRKEKKWEWNEWSRRFKRHVCQWAMGFFGWGVESWQLCVVLLLLLFRSHWKRYRGQTIERRQWAPCGLNHNISIMNKDPKKKRIIQFVVASLLKMFQTDYRRCVGTKRIPSSYSFVFHSLLFAHSIGFRYTFCFFLFFFSFHYYNWIELCGLALSIGGEIPYCILQFSMISLANVHDIHWSEIVCASWFTKQKTKKRKRNENQSNKEMALREKSVIYNILVCLNGITLPMKWRHFVSRWD